MTTNDDFKKEASAGGASSNGSNKIAPLLITAALAGTPAVLGVAGYGAYAGVKTLQVAMSDKKFKAELTNKCVKENDCNLGDVKEHVDYIMEELSVTRQKINAVEKGKPIGTKVARFRLSKTAKENALKRAREEYETMHESVSYGLEHRNPTIER